MIVIIGYGRTAKGALASLYIGEDMDAAIAALESAGMAGKIEQGFVIKDAEPVYRHTFDADDKAARAGAAARQKEADRVKKLSDDQKAKEAADVAQARRDQEADELERRAATLRAKPAGRLSKKAQAEKDKAEKTAADKAAQEQAEKDKAAQEAADAKTAAAAAANGSVPAHVDPTDGEDSGENHFSQ